MTARAATRTFDAVVERAVLMYVPDPAEVLRRQATVLRADGLVVPIEIDFTTGRALPPSPLVNQAVAWLTERLKDELQRNPAVHAHPILLSTWATTGGA